MLELSRGAAELASNSYTMEDAILALADERMDDCDTEAELERMFWLADYVCRSTGLDFG